ncbi:MAG: DUF3102 domain-containing protein [Verrucomicrobia bacterium]|nr:DUF3102 domain-containing protein [Verrucomicrobiota bacterium]
MAVEINQLHHDNVVAAGQCLQRAIRIGELLTEQKARLKHGEWLPWLRANVKFSSQTSDRYRAVYANRDKFPTVGNIGLTEAYRMLAQTSEPSLAECEATVERGLREIENLVNSVRANPHLASQLEEAHRNSHGSQKNYLCAVLEMVKDGFSRERIINAVEVA